MVVAGKGLFRFSGLRYGGSTVTVERDGVTVIRYSTLTRLAAGRVGARVLKNGPGNCGWDDVTVIKPGAV